MVMAPYPSLNSRTYYGYLFDVKKQPTKVLDALLRGIALYIKLRKTYADVEKKENLGDVTDRRLRPEKMAAFYRAVGGNYDSLFINVPPTTLSWIYASIGCQHLLLPTADNFIPPSIPSLTVAGFVRWQSIEILLGPEEHVPFIQESLRRFDIRHPETNQPFPVDLPTDAFPLNPDSDLERWHQQCAQKLRKGAAISSKYERPIVLSEQKKNTENTYPFMDALKIPSSGSLLLRKLHVRRHSTPAEQDNLKSHSSYDESNVEDDVSSYTNMSRIRSTSSHTHTPRNCFNYYYHYYNNNEKAEKITFDNKSPVSPERLASQYAHPSGSYAIQKKRDPTHEKENDDNTYYQNFTSKIYSLNTNSPNPLHGSGDSGSDSAKKKNKKKKGGQGRKRYCSSRNCRENVRWRDLDTIASILKDNKNHWNDFEGGEGKAETRRSYEKDSFKGMKHEWDRHSDWEKKNSKLRGRSYEDLSRRERFCNLMDGSRRSAYKERDSRSYLSMFRSLNMRHSSPVPGVECRSYSYVD